MSRRMSIASFGVVAGSIVLALACGRAPSSTSPTPAPAWQRLPVSEPLPADRPLVAGFLIVDGVYNSELMAPYDVLQHTIFHTKPGIEVFTVSPDGKPVRTFEGLTITPHHGFASAPPIDILVVPSAEHSMDRDLENEALISWVRTTGAAARLVLSACDGAFVLAKAGLLETVAMTTFPGDQDRYAEMFPHHDLRRGVSFVHDGKAITSWGGARSYDPAMYLVDHLYGEAVAKGVARGLVISWPPTKEAMPALVIAPGPAAK